MHSSKEATGSASVDDQELDESDLSDASSDEGEPIPEEEEDTALCTTPLQYSLKNIRHVISMLYELSATVLRRPAPRDRLQKSLAINVSHFEPFDIQHISHKVCAPEAIIARLGKANMRRRQLLRYYERHHKTLAKYIDVDMHTINVNSCDKKLRPDGESSTSPPEPPIFSVSKSHSIRESVAPTLPSQTTVTTFKGVSDPLQVDLEEKSDGGASLTSYANTTFDMSGRLPIPDPPGGEVSYNGVPFICPYCHLMIKTSGTRSWRWARFRNLLEKFNVLTTTN